MNRKKIGLILLIVMCTSGVFAEARGWGLGVGVFEEDVGVHARKDFIMGEDRQFDIVLQGGIYNQNKWTGRFDADFHYVFFPSSTFRLYPLAGLDFAIQSKKNRAGVNLGGGATVELNSATQIFVEAKYVVGDWDGFALTAGVYF